MCKSKKEISIEKQLDGGGDDGSGEEDCGGDGGDGGDGADGGGDQRMILIEKK